MRIFSKSPHRLIFEFFLVAQNIVFDIMHLKIRPNNFFSYIRVLVHCAQEQGIDNIGSLFGKVNYFFTGTSNFLEGSPSSGGTYGERQRRVGNLTFEARTPTIGGCFSVIYWPLLLSLLSLIMSAWAKLYKFKVCFLCSSCSSSSQKYCLRPDVPFYLHFPCNDCPTHWLPTSPCFSSSSSCDRFSVTTFKTTALSNLFSDH